MADTGYRLWLGATPATEAELARVEEIVVEQEMDVSWEARVRLSLCLDEQGRWKHGNEAFSQPFSRVRVEMLINGAATPLIDGSVVTVDSAMDARPGRSSITLVVQDDRFLLDREEAVDVREAVTEAALATELFDALPQPQLPHRIATPDADSPRVRVRRGIADGVSGESGAGAQLACLRAAGRVAGQQHRLLPTGPEPAADLAAADADGVGAQSEPGPGQPRWRRTAAHHRQHAALRRSGRGQSSTVPSRRKRCCATFRRCRCNARPCGCCRRKRTIRNRQRRARPGAPVAPPPRIG
jgi:hypothetical protein